MKNVTSVSRNFYYSLIVFPHSLILSISGLSSSTCSIPDLMGVVSLWSTGLLSFSMKILTSSSSTGTSLASIHLYFWSFASISSFPLLNFSSQFFLIWMFSFSFVSFWEGILIWFSYMMNFNSVIAFDQSCISFSFSSASIKNFLIVQNSSTLECFLLKSNSIYLYSSTRAESFSIWSSGRYFLICLRQSSGLLDISEIIFPHVNLNILMSFSYSW